MSRGTRLLMVRDIGSNTLLNVDAKRAWTVQELKAEISCRKELIGELLPVDAFVLVREGRILRRDSAALRAGVDAKDVDVCSACEGEQQKRRQWQQQQKQNEQQQQQQGKRDLETSKAKADDDWQKMLKKFREGDGSSSDNSSSDDDDANDNSTGNELTRN